ncbi:MAG: hypothetical protein A3F72_04585 [Bacteroidetes bacterium RIFCSPLOWO2_12_FULL_35_15]|nr:MAG: hypothetical protein A3F72_04585 [Bacteroidetes bacterium RIFCSPLOWO2_12_FULL_35_15]
METDHIRLAIENIAKYGDTDIFPFPIEKLVFFDKKEETIALIKKIDSDFHNYLTLHPPVNINSSIPLGYTGFRWATQIDPIWNAYFLAAVISIAKEIESTRIGKEENIIYSYRFSPNLENPMLFDTTYNWLKFQKDSLEFVKTNLEYNFVVICDIADFYNRINHHPLENSLNRLPVYNDIPKKIKKLIHKFSNTKSYGLPIGGEAARILAELVLNNTDRHLYNQGIKFKRFVDDLHIFCKTLQEAHSALNFLSIKLMRNEGLNLQKHKTQIQSRIEFDKLVSSRINADSDNEKEKHRAKFMSLPINYDPYSDSAEDDYRRIKKELEEFDIVGLLNDELRKVRIHQQFGTRLIKTFDVLEPEVISNAFNSIIPKYEILYPIFPTIMKSAYKHHAKLENNTKTKLHLSLRKLVSENSYIVQSEINMTYLLRVLGLEHSLLNEETVIKAYHLFADSILIKSIVIQIMTRWKAYHWLTDKKDTFSIMNKWERRMFIVAANFIGDEGEHWLNYNKKEFSDLEKLIMNWSKEKSSITNWELPL